METIGFIGAYDKTDLIIYVAKILQSLEKRVMVVDTTITQKTRYVVPAINPTIIYITEFEKIDFAVGFKNLEEIKQYLKLEKTEELPYDYILIDVDRRKYLKTFDIEKANKNYFVTAFDNFSLKRGITVLEAIEFPITVTKILFSHDLRKEDDERLNFLSMECNIKWNDYVIYFDRSYSDVQAIEYNQSMEQITFKSLSNEYKEGIMYLVLDIFSEANKSIIKKAMKN